MRKCRPVLSQGDIVVDRWYKEKGEAEIVKATKSSVYLKFPNAENGKLERYDLPHFQFLEAAPGKPLKSQGVADFI